MSGCPNQKKPGGSLSSQGGLKYPGSGMHHEDFYHMYPKPQPGEWDLCVILAIHLGLWSFLYISFFVDTSNSIEEDWSLDHHIKDLSILYKVIKTYFREKSISILNFKIEFYNFTRQESQKPNLKY